MSWPFTLQHPHLVNFITKSTHAVHDTIGFLFWLAQGKYSWSAARHQGDVGSTTEHSLFDFLDKWFAFDGNVLEGIAHVCNHLLVIACQDGFF